MTHLALYRKYRPEGFDSLIGQESIKKTLVNALKQQKVSHAYLFAGPRGTGKTSSAKLLAKALNCLSPKDYEPCGECNGCKESNPDIIEIDAASNNGVDEIRDIREKVQYTPVYGKYKVYIIDEVHMLTTAAFNALLKTLEEPPSHVVFILATTEPHKIPLTILSRCQRYDFRRISQQEIIDRMTFILSEEKQEAEEEALQLIAQIAAGGMRDALSLLDQCLSQGNDKVTLASVIELTGAVDSREIGKMISLINQNDTEGTLQHFNKCFQEGKEAKFFIEELMLYYRDILLFQKMGEEASLKKSITDEKFPAIAKAVSQAKIYANLEVLADTQSKLKFNQDSQLLVEIALIKMTQMRSGNVTAEVEMLKEEIAKLKEQFAKRVVSKPASPSQSVEETEETAEEIIDTIEDIVEDGVSEEEVYAEVSEQPEVEEEAPKENDGFVDISLDDLFAPLPKEEEPPKKPEAKEEKTESKSFMDVVAEEIQKEDSDWVEVNGEETTEANTEDDDPFADFDTIDVADDDFVEMISEHSKKTMKEPLDVPLEDVAASLEEFANVPEESETPSESQESNEDVDALISDIDEGALDTFSQETAGSDGDKQQLLSLLKTASKEKRSEFNEVYNKVLRVLKETKLSTYSLFKEFQIRAISADVIIVSHDDKLKVKLLEKVTNRSIVQSAIEEVFEPLKLVVVKKQDWLAAANEFLKK